MSTRTAFKPPTSKSSAFVFKLLKIVGTLTNLLKKIASAFKEIKSFQQLNQMYEHLWHVLILFINMI